MTCWVGLSVSPLAADTEGTVTGFQTFAEIDETGGKDRFHMAVSANHPKLRNLGPMYW